MQFPRASGVLAHPTSFPGRYGIGDLGTGAYGFIDFLVASKQSLWQILPLGPTGYGDSPYQCFSAFAGNPLLISPERLVRDGLLTNEAIAHAPQLNHCASVTFTIFLELRQPELSVPFRDGR